MTNWNLTWMPVFDNKDEFVEKIFIYFFNPYMISEVKCNIKLTENSSNQSASSVLIQVT